MGARLSEKTNGVDRFSIPVHARIIAGLVGAAMTVFPAFLRNVRWRAERNSPKRRIYALGIYTRVCLTLIVVLLVWLAIRPYTSVTTVQAYTPVQYKIIVAQSEDQLNTLGKDGWILVTCPWGTNGCVLRR